MRILAIETSCDDFETNVEKMMSTSYFEPKSENMTYKSYSEPWWRELRAGDIKL